MTGTSQNRWRRRTAVAASVVLGVLLVGCDNRALPTQPGGSANGPQGQRSTGPIAFVSDRDGTQRIYLANEDGSAVTPLVEGGQPAWAKDGRRIAFTAGRLEIHVIGVDGSGSRLIAAGGSEPGWSPDGRSLAFKNWRGDSDLDVVDVGGLEPPFPVHQRRLGLARGRLPRWCRASEMVSRRTADFVLYFREISSV